MARFDSLFQVGVVIAEAMRHYGGVVQPELGSPFDKPEGVQESARVTLLWTTPQPTHRNDPPFRDATGQLVPPPLTISAFFLVTTYGENNNGPEAAYNQLSRTLRAFWQRPVLALPDAALAQAAAFGEGELQVVQVPMAADLMEKIYAPLQAKHRQWALFEVGPVSLVPTDPPRPAAPVVRPGGLHLGGPEVMATPSIDRITPEGPTRGGRIRIDGTWPGPILGVRIGDVDVKAADISQPTAGGPLVVRLAALVPPVIGVGTHHVSVRVGRQYSERVPISVRPDTEASVEAPIALSHSLAADLDLLGRGLQTATEVAFWPDGGVASPTEVHTIPLVPADVSATKVTVRSPALLAAAPSARRYRVSVRISSRVYTPYVLLELTP